MKQFFKDPRSFDYTDDEKAIACLHGVRDLLNRREGKKLKKFKEPRVNTK